MPTCGIDVNPSFHLIRAIRVNSLKFVIIAVELQRLFKINSNGLSKNTLGR